MGNKNKVYVKAAWRRMCVYLAVHTGVDLRREKVEHICKAYANHLGIILPSGKLYHITFALEQYNNPESKIYKGNKSLKYSFKSGVAKKKEQTDKKKIYKNYLKSAKWINFRDQIKEKRGNKCEICGIVGVILDGHHLTYANFMNELETDIQIVCRQCHENIHFRKNKKRLRTKNETNTITKQS